LCRLWLDTKFVCERVVELVGGQKRVEYIGRQHVLILGLEMRSQGCCLARSNFACDNEQAFCGLYPVLKVGQHLKQTFRSEKVSRIRRQPEREVLKSIEFQVHSYPRFGVRRVAAA